MNRGLKLVRVFVLSNTTSWVKWHKLVPSRQITVGKTRVGEISLNHFGVK